ncbi:hypothetical protein [Ornithinibacillus halotolerans]|uniref:Uncharacterized protein n=1 Tax=Ornithinibacillus halotolerans TaxID=1274357 RepID=A0A916S8Z5_9BACI|nr:hypothetical protein [Ornithinibacillus halotolerans]GGA90310.1 hypothetical protein GCM10008025_36090 [Ornithinibacillus halotolerans]
MGTFTAQILVGQKHSYDGGILNISHVLYLSENNRPAWVLVPMDIFSEHKEMVEKRVTWIPTVENMLEDALVMVGLYVLKDNKLRELTNQYLETEKDDFVELYDIPQHKRQELYNYVKTIEGSHKIMLSVFRGSTIANQLPVLEEFKNDIEVCTSVYTKEFSLWSKQYEISGHLDSK